MSIKQNGGVFGRNPTFNDVTIEGQLTFDGDIDVNSDLKVDGNLDVTGTGDFGGKVKVTTSGNGEIDVERTSGALINLQAQSARGIIGTNSNHELQLKTNGGGRLKITTGGNVEVMLGNLVIGTSGKGIDFSATAGTGTSELFDDYEEGTWTPVLSDASSGGNLGSATINKANYTKVGRSVTLSASLSDIVTTGMGSSLPLYIQGLPFTSASSNSSFGVVKIDTVALQGGRTSAVCEVSDSDAWFRFWAIGDAIADTPIDCGDITSGTSDIFFTVSYHV
jgi:hypothetical protein